MNGDTKALTEFQAIAAEALTALDTCHQISPFSARLSAFDLDDAYRVTAAIRQMRETRKPVAPRLTYSIDSLTIVGVLHPMSSQQPAADHRHQDASIEPPRARGEACCLGGHNPRQDRTSLDKVKQ